MSRHSFEEFGLQSIFYSSEKVIVTNYFFFVCFVLFFVCLF